MEINSLTQASVTIINHRLGMRTVFYAAVPHSQVSGTLRLAVFFPCYCAIAEHITSRFGEYQCIQKAGAALEGVT